MIDDELLSRAAERKATVVLPDANDIRTVEAAEYLTKHGIATPCIIDQATRGDEAGLVTHLLSTRSHKGMTAEQAWEVAQKPLYKAAWMVANSTNLVGVAGSISTTADVLRAGLWTIGLAESATSVSSFFLMAHPNGHLMTFADCAVVPVPTATQLSEIAWLAANNHQRLTKHQPRVAFLSYSTKGSASHESVDTVIEAMSLFATHHPEIIADGELQADAAIVPSIAHRKAPGSPVAGLANVLVFPDLNSGNIAYKLTERLGGYAAYGPIVQGLRKPFVDLSRGCSAHDIVMTSAIAILLNDPCP